MKLKNGILSCLMIAGMLSANFVPISAKENTMPDGAIFKRLESIDAEVYSYTPSVLYNPTPMMTPVFYVFPNEDVKDENDAYKELEDAGLIALAEQEKAGIFLINSIDENYSEKDVQTYKDICDMLVVNNEAGYTSYNNLMYAIGEGNGATFINEYMTQNAERLAGILTFGGEIKNAEKKMSLPAYLVNANENAIQFYKTINDTNSQTAINGKTCYYNSQLTTEKVIIDTTKSNEMDANIINNAWNSLLRLTTRNIIEKCLWASAYNMTSGGSNDPVSEVFTLMDRYTPESLELVFHADVEENNDENEVYPGVWNEWIPSEALDENNTKKYPLIMCYHGSGDHPVFEAECNGWVELAGSERFIVISPEWQIRSNTNGNDYSITADVNKKFINYICEKYPVDTSRIYATGFSAGSGQTLTVASAYPELFAGIAPIAVPTDNTRLNISEDKYDSIDLPVFFGTGTMDMYTSVVDKVWGKLNPKRIDNVINNALKLNEMDDQLIDTSKLDYDKYQWYGFDVSKNTESYTSKHGLDINLTSYSNKNNIEMVKIMAVKGMEHNHYTEFAPNIWNFLKNFSRDTETNELIYKEPISPETMMVGDKIEVGQYTVEKLTDNVYNIQDYTTQYPAKWVENYINNCSDIYLVLDDNEALLIDAGNKVLTVDYKTDLEFEKVLETFVGNRHLQLALTHNHGDHTGQLANGVIPNGTTVYIGEQDYTDSIKEMLTNYDVKTVKAGDTITLPNYTFEVKQIQKHTEGSLGYLDKEHQILFSGDSLGSGFVWQFFTDDPLTAFDKDVRELYEDVKNLENLKVLPGHSWQKSLVGYDKYDLNFIKDCITLLDEIKAGKAKTAPYTDRGVEGDIYIYSDKVKFQIDTTQEIYDAYLASIKKDINNSTDSTDKNTTSIPTSAVKTGDKTNILCTITTLSLALATSYALKRKKETN